MLDMGSIKNRIILNKKQSFLHFENEFSHIYRRKSICELIRISMAVMGIEFTYAALTAFVSPVLLELGIQFNKMSLVWGISPVIGFFLSPIMGTLSDRCRLKFGRRRPFILLFSVFNVVGLLLIPFGQWLANAVKHVLPLEPYHDNETTTSVPSSSTRIVGILVTIIGIVITDYTSDALQNPSRAYLLDVCRADDHARGLTTFTVLAGSGGFIGYLLGAVDWKHIQIFGYGVHNGIFSGHIQIFYTITAIVFAFCIGISITTFKEVPLKVTEYMRLETNIMSESDFYEKELEEVAPIYSKPKTYGSDNTEPNIVQSEDSMPSMMNYLRSIIHMPNSMKILCLTNLFCWMAHASYSLYFTEFVGSVIFGGEPNAAADSRERILYEDGVRFGCLGLAIYSLSCMFYSFAVESLVKRFGLKKIFMTGVLIDSISLLLMAILRNKISVIVLSASCGIFYATLFTVPYILIAHYHSTNVFELDSCGDIVPQKLVRGLGTDVSLIGSCVFVSQFLLSLIIGLITQFITSSVVVMVTGSILALCAFFVCTKVMYLDM